MTPPLTFAEADYLVRRFTEVPEPGFVRTWRKFPAISIADGALYGVSREVAIRIPGKSRASAEGPLPPDYVRLEPFAEAPVRRIFWEKELRSEAGRLLDVPAFVPDDVRNHAPCFLGLGETGQPVLAQSAEGLFGHVFVAKGRTWRIIAHALERAQPKTLARIRWSADTLLVDGEHFEIVAAGMRPSEV